MLSVDFDGIDTEIAHGLPDVGEHTREALAGAGVHGDVVEALLTTTEEPSL